MLNTVASRSCYRMAQNQCRIIALLCLRRKLLFYFHLNEALIFYLFFNAKCFNLAQLLPGHVTKQHKICVRSYSRYCSFYWLLSCVLQEWNRAIKESMLTGFICLKMFGCICFHLIGHFTLICHWFSLRSCEVSEISFSFQQLSTSVFIHLKSQIITSVFSRYFTRKQTCTCNIRK